MGHVEGTTMTTYQAWLAFGKVHRLLLKETWCCRLHPTSNGVRTYLRSSETPKCGEYADLPVQTAQDTFSLWLKYGRLVWVCIVLKPKYY